MYDYSGQFAFHVSLILLIEKLEIFLVTLHSYLLIYLIQDFRT
jgi:hypothetical protein